MKLNTSRYNQHWNEKALSELGQFQRGKSKHRPRNDPALFSNGTYPLIQTGEIKQANLYLNSHAAAYNDFGLSQSKLWPKNTLCITIAANIAETALLAYPMCFPDSIVGFNADPEKSSELFMHYVFTYIRSAIQNAATGSIQDNINVEYLSSLKLQIPEKEYQDKIAAVLSALDAKIDCNQRINAQLEALAKTLYDYWFVQFDFPNAQGQPYRSAGGAMQFSSALGRDIPQGWEVKSLSDIANITMGTSPTGDTLNQEGNGTLFFQGSTDFGWRFPSVRQFTTSPLRMAKTGDILLSVRAPVGDLNIAHTDCCIGRGLAALNSKSGFDGFLFYVLLHLKSVFDRRNSEGTTFGAITKDDLHSLKLVCPPIEWLKKFDESVRKQNQIIFVRSMENQHLAQLRDWLLPLLMNGQVRVA